MSANNPPGYNPYKDTNGRTLRDTNDSEMTQYSRSLGLGESYSTGVPGSSDNVLYPEEVALHRQASAKKLTSNNPIARGDSLRKLARGDSVKRLPQLDRFDPANAYNSSVTVKKPSTSLEKFQSWMINEGARTIFFGVWIFLHTLVFSMAFLNFIFSDNWNGARGAFGITFVLARSAALVLHVDAAMILFPVCRNLISLLRATPLNGIIPFDENIEFHKAVGWSIVFFTIVHTVSHWINFWELAKAKNGGIILFLKLNFLTGPGATGYFMLIFLFIMVVTATDKSRQRHFNRFWYLHHLFILFFAAWSFHGAFCMIQPDRPPFCGDIAVFWKYWITSGTIYVAERVLREIRGRHKTYISKVVMHPQYEGIDISTDNPDLQKILPRVMVDGPFGSASEDVFKFEVAILVGAGIGVTPFASILKSIWYRVTYPTKSTKLRKAYFFWICRDYSSFEWFQSLLLAIEERDIDQFIEIHTYLTGRLRHSEVNNILVNDDGSSKDTITRLKAPTHFGRPNWDKIFSTMRDQYPATDVGVFFCGPKPLGNVLHEKCNLWSQGFKDGTRFFYGKENF
ncbi:14628_t:CDS:2 [Acaulospora morrowiae]|uniref:14628_t:CDS:1 n=1 Tax=Acaulospora morrowiae TaxID=94023 RepID=A0A9N8ZKG4_9GLOM|nr:14628_t:CDS:2 [Acaulospora morrowiae]